MPLVVLYFPFTTVRLSQFSPFLFFFQDVTQNCDTPVDQLHIIVPKMENSKWKSPVLFRPRPKKEQFLDQKGNSGKGHLSIYLMQKKMLDDLNGIPGRQHIPWDIVMP